jgi:hypothetical protein
MYVYTYSSSQQPPDPLIGFAGERRGKRVSFYSLGNHHYQPPDEIYDIREGGRESERKYISDPERRRREKKEGSSPQELKRKELCVYV